MYQNPAIIKKVSEDETQNRIKTNQTIPLHDRYCNSNPMLKCILLRQQPLFIWTAGSEVLQSILGACVLANIEEAKFTQELF